MSYCHLTPYFCSLEEVWAVVTFSKMSRLLTPWMANCALDMEFQMCPAIAEGLPWYWLDLNSLLVEGKLLQILLKVFCFFFV